MTNLHSHTYAATTLCEGRIVRLLCPCGFSQDTDRLMAPADCDHLRIQGYWEDGCYFVTDLELVDDTFPNARGFGRVCFSCGSTVASSPLTAAA